MSIVKKILYFLGGKPPEIIFKDRQVFHQHKNEKWEDWKNRFKKPEYDWHKHSGKK